MRRELSEKLRGIGGSWAKQDTLRQEVLDHIKVSPDRVEAFSEVVKGIDIALVRIRGLGREFSLGVISC